MNGGALWRSKNSLIKCLIWLGFLFVNSAITTGLVYAGVRLGAIPTVLLFAVAYYAARSCCKAYDRKHAPLPSAADTGEEPKSASPADGDAAEEPAERQENREEAEIGEIIQLANVKSVQPEQPVKENKPRRVSQKPVILTLSVLVVVLTASCCLLGIICNACRKVCRLQTDLSWRRLPTSERLTNALTDMWIILKNTYHGNMFLSLIDSAIPEHLRATSAATPFRIRIHIHGINENLQIRNSVLECALGCAKPRTGVVRGFVLIAAAQAPPATRRHRRRLACASRRGG